MKQLSSLVLLVCLLATTLQAKENSPVAPNVDAISETLKADQAEMDDAFQSLNDLEARIKSEGLTYDALDNATVSELALKEDVKGALVAVAGADDLPLGIPGFWWGFCLGLVGILLVYILMEDSPDRKEQTKKALIGALIWVGIWLLFWILFWASFAVI